MTNSVAKKIAEDTWDRLEQSKIHNVRLGEETLTELLVLDFARHAPKGIKLYQTSKSEEARTGTDLEVLVETGGNEYIAFVIQAKKLYSSGRYSHLNAKVSGTNTYQIDILQEYSRRSRTIPLYLLYNFVEGVEEACEYEPEIPRCFCQTIESVKYLGCTLVPIWQIRQAINTPGCRNFDSIHNLSSVFPWHCLFDCKKQGWLSLIHLIQYGFRKEKYDWLQFEPVKNAGFDYLWNYGQNIYGISDQELDTLEWDMKHEISTLEETDIEAFYGYRDIKRDTLKFAVKQKNNNQNNTRDLIDLIPRRFLLIKSE